MVDSSLIIGQLLNVIAQSKLFSELDEQTIISDNSFFASINTNQEDAKRVKLPLLRGFNGDWNPVTNTPNINDVTSLVSGIYRVSASGIRDLGSGVVNYTVGDLIYHNGFNWVTIYSKDAMLKSVYDTNDNGVVDNSDLLSGRNLDFEARPNTIVGRNDIDGAISSVIFRLNDWDIKQIGGVLVLTSDSLGIQIQFQTLKGGTVALTNDIPTRNNIVKTSTNYTAVLNDYVIASPLILDITITLPTAVGIAGKEINVTKGSDNRGNVIVDTFGTELISGETIQTITTAFNNITLISDGVDWLIK